MDDGQLSLLDFAITASGVKSFAEVSNPKTQMCIRDRVLIALPASLRKQWELELEAKFGLESVILDRLTVEKDSSDWRKRLTDNKSVRIVLTSYDYSCLLYTSRCV